MQHPDSFTRQSKSALIHLSKGNWSIQKIVSFFFFFFFFFFVDAMQTLAKLKLLEKVRTLTTEKDTKYLVNFTLQVIILPD